ncbi:MAG: hypothetical protein HYZ01_14180, partial [Ignavibacteriales bacterium]|nr:hypothetical protein [Ignavibacteriales bacterium]
MRASIDNTSLTKISLGVIVLLLNSIIVSGSFAQTEFLPQEAIYLDNTKQVIRGFGAANILDWRPDMTDAEIETAFGTGDGQLGFTILRLRVQPDSNQWSLNVRTAKKAYDMGVTIIASPWSPPASIKTNNDLVGG